jgi:hypothetical protein
MVGDGIVAMGGVEHERQQWGIAQKWGLESSNLGHVLSSADMVGPMCKVNSKN